MAQHSATTAPPDSRPPLGSYLVEAGLLTDAQVGVALADQAVTAMLFGEIIVARGWLKEQTIEFIMQKVVLPERKPQPTSGMQDCLNHRRRPASGQPASATSQEEQQGTISWIG